MTDKTIKAGALVPGLPHLLLDRALNKSYLELAGALEALGDAFAAQGVKRVVYYSTQWISVLGHSFQAREALAGYHVDENWHELGDLPFDFKVDGKLAESMAAKAAKAGYQARLVDYNGFPVDTATIVADRLLNKGRFTTGMVSCCVYSDYADTQNLAGIVAEAVRETEVPTAFVAVTTLSGRYFTTEIDLREDHIASNVDDEWNKRILGLFEKGAYSEVESLIPEYAGACKVDMGLKALAFLKGVGVAKEGVPARKRAYGSLYGTGAAVVEMS